MLRLRGETDLLLIVVLLVITLDHGTACWAAETISFGVGARLTPVVIGPDATGIAVATHEGSQPLDEARGSPYLDLIFRSLNDVARAALEQLMIQGYPYRSPSFRRLQQEARQQGLQDGRQEGAAALFLRQHRGRFGEPSVEPHARILGAEPSDLEVWAPTPLFADTLEAVFRDPASGAP